MAPGTARKPASRKRFSPQPSNFEGTLSHHDAFPGPPEMALKSLSRNESSTAFFSHWCTFHFPPASRSATRASPLSSSSSAVSIASRTSPLVAVEIFSRASNAALTVDSRADEDIVASLAERFRRRLFPDLAEESQPCARPCRPFEVTWRRWRDAFEDRKSSLGLRQLLQKPRQIVGDVIDMGGTAALQLPVLPHHLFRAVRYDQHCRHAELVRDDEVARQILEHRRLRGIDVMQFQKSLIGLRRGLGLELGRDDIEHPIEMSSQPKA